MTHLLLNTALYKLNPMLTLFGKKKITTERTAHLFTHYILETADHGFPDIAGFINDSPEFVRHPNVLEENLGHFLMIVIAGNYQYIGQHFTDGQDALIIEQCNLKFAPVFDLSVPDFCKKVKEYQDLMSRLNSPSKNIIYGMSRAIFEKYELTDKQDEYFRSMKAQNPIFLKNLNDLIRNFIWDWDSFNEKYKVVTSA